MDLEVFWFCLIAVLLGGLLPARGLRLRRRHAAAVPAARTSASAKTMLETIGPVWDGNEVWLVVAGGATFAAFPAWYATMFSGFYLALLLVLVLLIVRVVSFEWRGKSDEPALAGDLAGGELDRQRRRTVPVGRRHSPACCTACRSTPTATSPAASSTSSASYTVFAGIAVVLLFAFHGATFLTLRVVGRPPRARRRGGARGSPIPAAVDRRAALGLDGRRRDRPQRQGPVPAARSRRLLGVVALVPRGRLDLSRERRAPRSR